MLREALEDPEPVFQARALQAVGELKRRDLLAVIQRRFQSDNVACRFWAAWSALLLGDSMALEILKSFVNQESVFRERAIQLVFRVMEKNEAQFNLTELADQSGGLRSAILGTGVAGDPARIPWLIELMTPPEMARFAGEAFSMITGVDIHYENLEGECPEGFEAGPTDNPADENVDMNQDEGLPWPDHNLIKAWWDKNKGGFKTGTRYLCGQPITESNLQHLLRYGYQRQRHAAALELAIRNPDQPLFNIHAPGFRQKQLLGLK
jgi:uncharacterized protein (TIGR02270 family)